MGDNSVSDKTDQSGFIDIVYQGNILLFYIQGEIEKLKYGKLLDTQRESAFSMICHKLNDVIQIMLNTDETTYKEVSDKLNDVKKLLEKQSILLDEKGGAVKYLAKEIGYMADRVNKTK